MKAFLLPTNSCNYLLFMQICTKFQKMDVIQQKKTSCGILIIYGLSIIILYGLS